MMKPFTKALAAIVLCSIFPAMAQENQPNLSGTWILDNAKSHLVANTGGIDSGMKDLRGSRTSDRNISTGAMSGARNNDAAGRISNRLNDLVIPQSGGPADRYGNAIDLENMNLALDINQSEENLKVAWKYQSDNKSRIVLQTFSLNGDASFNSIPTGPGEFFSESFIEADQIVSLGTQSLSTPKGNRLIVIREEYCLSDKGQTLILKTNRTAEHGEISSELVFHRQTDI